MLSTLPIIVTLIRVVGVDPTPGLTPTGPGKPEAFVIRKIRQCLMTLQLLLRWLDASVDVDVGRGFLEKMKI